MAGIDQFRGALLGGACGDALGYPLQSFSVSRIQRRFGPFGLRTLVREEWETSACVRQHPDGTGND